MLCSRVSVSTTVSYGYCTTGTYQREHMLFFLSISGEEGREKKRKITRTRALDNLASRRLLLLALGTPWIWNPAQGT